MFLRNEAVLGAQCTRGGAIDAAAGAVLFVSETTFDGNAATGSSESSGGAVHSGGLLVLESGLVFRANVATGDIRAKGGAIALVSASAILNATCLSGPVFVGNAVRHASLLALRFCERFGLCKQDRRLAILLIAWFLPRLRQAHGTDPVGGALFIEAPSMALVSAALFESNTVLVSSAPLSLSCRH